MKYDFAKQFSNDKEKDINFFAWVLTTIIVALFFWLMFGISGPICNDYIGGVCI